MAAHRRHVERRLLRVVVRIVSWFSRGRHRANIHSRSVWDLEAELAAESRDAELQKTSPWPVVVHEGREYWQVECMFWPDGDFEGEKAYIAMAPSTSVPVIGIVTDTPAEEVPPWSKRM